jgi:hypothetical protein
MRVTRQSFFLTRVNIIAMKLASREVSVLAGCGKSSHVQMHCAFWQLLSKLKIAFFVLHTRRKLRDRESNCLPKHPLERDGDQNPYGYHEPECSDSNSSGHLL